MRKQRSMSVYVPMDRMDHDRLSKKFEGVVSDNEAHFDSEDETKEDEVLSEEWTKADYESLVTQLKEALPKKDIRKWKTTLKAVNWDRIKVGQHTAQEVKEVAMQLIGKIRPFRILSEMLNDMPQLVTKLLCADRPKPPPNAYSLFLKELYLQGEHKDINQIFKIGKQLFQELSPAKRYRYEEKYANLKAEYHANLEKFYQDHPDLKPIRKEPRKTPFQLFFQSRRATSESVSCQQARKEWEQLPFKKKITFIQSSYEAQADTSLLNKKELLMLEQTLGKPEFVGRNVFEFFCRKVRSRQSAATKNEREDHIRTAYKQLDAQAKLLLKEEFQEARSKYVLQYQKYIKKLPKDKRQAEREFLKKITGKIAKKSPKTEKDATEDESRFVDSRENNSPAAESTPIDKQLSTGEKSKKRPTFSGSLPSSASLAFSSDDDESENDTVRQAQTKHQDSSSRNASKTKKRTSTENVQAKVELKKAKKTPLKVVNAEHQVEEPKSTEDVQVEVEAKRAKKTPLKAVNAEARVEEPNSTEYVQAGVKVKKAKKISLKVMKAVMQDEESKSTEDVQAGVKVKKAKKTSLEALKAEEQVEKSESTEDVQVEVEVKNAKKTPLKVVKAVGQVEDEEPKSTEKVQAEVKVKKAKKTSLKVVNAGEKVADKEWGGSATKPAKIKMASAKALKTKKVSLKQNQSLPTQKTCSVTRKNKTQFSIYSSSDEEDQGETSEGLHPLMMEGPVKPPTDIEEFYRQHFYKGKPGKHVESFARLTTAEKRIINEQLEVAVEQYLVELEKFLSYCPIARFRSTLSYDDL